MARINIEDSLFKDRRYLAFVVRMGDPTLALGAFVEACIVAQEFFLNEKTSGRIPIEAWRERGLREEIISTGLAEISDSFVKLRGSDEHFAWLRQRSDAGRMGGRKTQSTVKRPKSDVKPLTLSPPLTLTPSLSSDSSSFSKTTRNSANSQKASRFVAGYCERFKFRWGTNPLIKGKESGIAKRVVKDIGDDRLDLYLDAFFAMPDAWLVKTKHPLAAFETKLNEIVVFANTGNFMTQRQAHQADDTASNMILLQQVREGKI